MREEKRRRIDDLSEKVIKGMNIAIRKLVEKAAAENRELVVGDEYGNVKCVPARITTRI